MTTIHAYINDEVLIDVYHEDLRRARSATMSMYRPDRCRRGRGLVLPAQRQARRLRHPGRRSTCRSSTLSFIAARDTTVEEVNAIMKAAADSAARSTAFATTTRPARLRRLQPRSASSTFDATLTKVSGRLVKVSAWYDNEWGFSNRMLDTTVAMMAAKCGTSVHHHANPGPRPPHRGRRDDSAALLPRRSASARECWPARGDAIRSVSRSGS